MTRFHGRIGFARTEETAPGVWSPTETVRTYFGDVNRMGYRWEGVQSSVNDQFAVTNYISIIADKFAYDNFSGMRWVEWLGQKWKINSAEVNPPRITLTIAGLYNGTDPIEA